jgi:NAD(P)-dependent dehydrogenase (short-subunit alcohol dehydrogenase family)
MSLSRREFFQFSLAATLPLSTAACSDGAEVEPDSRFPRGPFGPQSTAEDVTAGIDLSGRSALVTGATSGLGLETMRVLALRGAHVFGTGRTLEKAAQACASVTGTTTPLALELEDFQSAVDCAKALHAAGVVPDMVILNAGINTFGELELTNGAEKMFAVNFLGHFVLVNHLLPPMLEARRGRIVHVGSRSAYTQAPDVGIDFDNLRGERHFDAGEAYGRSKLANALFSLELAQRLDGSGVTSNVVHPGLVQTNIARTAPAIVRTLFSMFGGVVAKSPAEGAATQVYVATSPALDGVNGAYFEDCNPVRVSGDNHVFDAAQAAQLWQVAEQLTAQYIDPGVPPARQAAWASHRACRLQV